MEKSLAIIKPDAVARNLSGDIISMILDRDIQIVAMKMRHLTVEEAKGFYIVHQDRPFYNDLVEFMSSGPVITMVLAGENVIQSYRGLMGATNPKDAEPNTIRGKYAFSIDHNCVHGSDAEDTAQFEIEYLFDNEDLCL
ncbi:MAG: nucleoside-diphosphate kinase [bacterium TMED178]|nr:MAG: nucleoside-diphosphate kinase [bacterium TMED178]|tara:strand:- start:6174 stop:6590 length:417 start_codon:yes stop_codon:yes gene_type:complete